MITKLLFAVVVSVSTLLACTQGNKLNLIHYPTHVQFVTPTNKLETSEIPGTIISMLGLSSDYPLKWDGLLEGNIFKRPKAVTLFSIESTREILLKDSVKSYDLLQNTGDIDATFINNKLEAVDWKVKPLLLESSVDNQLFDLKSNYPDFVSSKTIDGIQSDLVNSDWMKNHMIGSLSLSSDLELAFISELFAISDAMEKLKENANVLKTNSPNFLHFKISGLKPLENKKCYNDAIDLLNEVLHEVRNDLIGLFSGNVVIATVTLNPDVDQKLIFGRHLQEANTTSSETNQSKFNRAPKHTYMYPVIFNIILWFSIAFVIALIWISWSIWHMDPGRDSVIYRMTTQRLKRD